MYRLLLVDDEKMALIASLHSFPWASHGFAPPLTCSNAHEALTMLRTEHVDAVFIDIRMPVLSGIDIIRTCRQEGIDTEFIVISGYSDFEYARAALQLFALDYCLKPVLPEDAVRVLERLSSRLYEVRLKNDRALLASLEPRCGPNTAQAGMKNKTRRRIYQPERKRAKRFWWTKDRTPIWNQPHGKR